MGVDAKMQQQLKPEVIKRFKIRSYACLGALALAGMMWAFWNGYVFLTGRGFSGNEDDTMALIRSMLEGGPLYLLIATIVVSLFLRIRLVQLSLDPHNLEDQ